MECVRKSVTISSSLFKSLQINYSFVNNEHRYIFMECVRKSVTISSSLLREMQLEYICIWPLVHGKFWQRLIDLFGFGRTENDEIFFVAVAGLSCSVDFPVSHGRFRARRSLST